MRQAIFFALGLSLVGCVQMPINIPWQQVTPEQAIEKDLDIGTVGDVTEVANTDYIQVSGVGLVIGLDGTGGSPPGQYRTMLEQQLRKQKVDNTKRLLDSADNALVLVTAFLPAGVRKGERIDVEVTLPPGSKATSLKGGQLVECSLRNFETTKNLNPEAAGNRLLSGHVLAKAQGSLLVGLGNPEDATEVRRGRIWSGAVSFIERPFYLVLTKDDKKSAKVANAIAERLNLQFQDDPRRLKAAQNNIDLMLIDGVTQKLNSNFDNGFGKGDMARAVNKEMITLRVPYAYRYNHERLLRVSRLMPLTEDVASRTKYRQRLDEIMTDPKQCVRAALRLEALGKEGMTTLRKGLDSPHALVRFCAAESLAYLGSTAGVEEMARLVIDHPEMRAYSLIALAGLDEAICRNKLAELLAHDDPELRGGAFRSLRLLDENDPRLHDEPIGNSYSLHKVAPNSPSFVCFSTNKRAEVVIFGPELYLKPPVKVLAAGEFTVTAEIGDERATVSRFTVKGTQRKQCSLLLEDVLRAASDLGASYADVIDLLKNLDDQQALPCPIREIMPPAATGLESLMAGDTNESKLADEK